MKIIKSIPYILFLFTYSYAGPFTASGQSTGQSTEKTYKKSIKPSMDKTVVFTKTSVDTSVGIAKNTSGYSGKVSDYSVDFFKNSSKYT